MNVAGAPVGFGISIPACAFLIMLVKYRPKQFVSDDAPVSDGVTHAMQLEGESK